MPHIVGFGGSVATNTSGSINRPIPNNPNSIILAEFGFSTSEAASLYTIDATVGVTAGILNPVILYTIFDIVNNTPIFTAVDAAPLALLNTKVVSFQSVQLNLPPGFHAYRLTATVTNGLPLVTGASVTGPSTLSAVAYTY